ncbi:hypothetical protein KR093_006386 [Drosophila rubida]|uniref:Titin homolog n=1 Tax=Drosophila rubida TaxID=30044 RepID=A0AAD4K0U5_9MUSC|nr:hypothetical protein KR093_006386 [Drosophila rubida]
MRPYICLLELPMYQGNHNLFLGLSSVLGLIGGAYLLQCGAQRLLSKIVVKKHKKEDEEELQSCNVCCADLDTSSAKNYVTCCTCGKFVCRGIKCADWRPKDAQWECELCHSSKQSLAHTSSWVAEQMCFNQQKIVYPLRARSEVYIPITDSSMQFESVSQAGANSMSNMTGDERNRIREYVEEIVAEMLGSNLDHIKVGQLSRSENYMQLFDRYHAKLSNLLINVENALCARALKGDLPAIVNGNNNNNNTNSNNAGDNNELSDISQTRLRNLIENIIAETLRSGANTLGPSAAVSEISLDTRSNGQLSNGNKRRHRTEHYFEPKIYQDLLATAVLNKIADKEGNTRLISESTPDLSGHNIDENYNAEALSTTSGSSIEPRSDCSLTDNELLLNTGKADAHAGLQVDLERESVLSDYIAAHMVPLPDFSASVTESEDDITSLSSSMVGDATWEDNWLFKKKRSTLQSSATPSSIGMLVPAPKENVRAQIGDRTADEVSDLSEIGSDAEDASLDLLRCNDLNDRLLSKHLIGGQNTKLVLDELVDRTSLTSNTLPEEHEPAFTETTNSFVTQPPTVAVPQEQLAPPPPMSFQDDQENEDPAQTLIAASSCEADDLADLEGCTGFGNVEYLDENPVDENTPSVIEILAAMALGPMLAVPASEQPPIMTATEIHTLKELSDLALAEINARTMDLTHHSLDIIEEEYADAQPVQILTPHDVIPSPFAAAVESTESAEKVPKDETVFEAQVIDISEVGPTPDQTNPDAADAVFATLAPPTIDVSAYADILPSPLLSPSLFPETPATVTEDISALGSVENVVLAEIPAPAPEEVAASTTVIEEVAVVDNPTSVTEEVPVPVIEEVLETVMPLPAIGETPAAGEDAPSAKGEEMVAVAENATPVTEIVTAAEIPNCMDEVVAAVSSLPPAEEVAESESMVPPVEEITPIEIPAPVKEEVAESVIEKVAAISSSPAAEEVAVSEPMVPSIEIPVPLIEEVITEDSPPLATEEVLLSAREGNVVLESPTPETDKVVASDIPTPAIENVATAVGTSPAVEEVDESKSVVPSVEGTAASEKVAAAPEQIAVAEYPIPDSIVSAGISTAATVNVVSAESTADEISEVASSDISATALEEVAAAEIPSVSALEEITAVDTPASILKEDSTSEITVQTKEEVITAETPAPEAENAPASGTITEAVAMAENPTPATVEDITSETRAPVVEELYVPEEGVAADSISPAIAKSEILPQGVKEDPAFEIPSPEIEEVVAAVIPSPTKEEVSEFETPVPVKEEIAAVTTASPAVEEVAKSETTPLEEVEAAVIPSPAIGEEVPVPVTEEVAETIETISPSPATEQISTFETSLVEEVPVSVIEEGVTAVSPPPATVEEVAALNTVSSEIKEVLPTEISAPVIEEVAVAEIPAPSVEAIDAETLTSDVKVAPLENSAPTLKEVAAEEITASTIEVDTPLIASPAPEEVAESETLVPPVEPVSPIEIPRLVKEELAVAEIPTTVIEEVALAENPTPATIEDNASETRAPDIEGVPLPVIEETAAVVAPSSANGEVSTQAIELAAAVNICAPVTEEATACETTALATEEVAVPQTSTEETQNAGTLEISAAVVEVVDAAETPAPVIEVTVSPSKAEEEVSDLESISPAIEKVPSIAISVPVIEEVVGAEIVSSVIPASTIREVNTLETPVPIIEEVTAGEITLTATDEVIAAEMSSPEANKVVTSTIAIEEVAVATVTEKVASAVIEEGALSVNPLQTAVEIAETETVALTAEEAPPIETQAPVKEEVAATENSAPAIKEATTMLTDLPAPEEVGKLETMTESVEQVVLAEISETVIEEVIATEILTPATEPIATSEASIVAAVAVQEFAASDNPTPTIEEVAAAETSVPAIEEVEVAATTSTAAEKIAQSETLTQAVKEIDGSEIPAPVVEKVPLSSKSTPEAETVSTMEVLQQAVEEVSASTPAAEKVASLDITASPLSKVATVEIEIITHSEVPVPATEELSTEKPESSVTAIATLETPAAAEAAIPHILKPANDEVPAPELDEIATPEASAAEEVVPSDSPETAIEEVAGAETSVPEAEKVDASDVPESAIEEVTATEISEPTPETVVAAETFVPLEDVIEFETPKSSSKEFVRMENAGQAATASETSEPEVTVTEKDGTSVIAVLSVETPAPVMDQVVATEISLPTPVEVVTTEILSPATEELSTIEIPIPVIREVAESATPARSIEEVVSTEIAASVEEVTASEISARPSKELPTSEKVEVAATIATEETSAPPSGEDVIATASPKEVDTTEILLSAPEDVTTEISLPGAEDVPTTGIPASESEVPIQVEKEKTSADSFPNPNANEQSVPAALYDQTKIEENMLLKETNDEVFVPQNVIFDSHMEDAGQLGSEIAAETQVEINLLQLTADTMQSEISALGKQPLKCLQRQPNIVDTTPSDEDSSPRPVNFLGTICKVYIKDKRLLATIERRRRRALIMHKYLSSFDSLDDESVDDVEYETNQSLFDTYQHFSLDNNMSGDIDSHLVSLETDGTSAEEFTFHKTQEEVDVELVSHYSDIGSQTSVDLADDIDIDNEFFIIGSFTEIGYNFINHILFSDQLSSNSSDSNVSTPSTSHETFNGDGDSVNDYDTSSNRTEFVDETVSSRTLTNVTTTTVTLTNHARNSKTTNNNNTNTTTQRTRPSGKLTNGSLRWSKKSVMALPDIDQQNGVHKNDDDDQVNDVNNNEDDVVLLRRFAPGSIAEREVKKWYNAVEMPNNPYAPEALKQRISGTQERFMDVPNISPSVEQKALALMTTESVESASRAEDYKRYSRDYYINNAPSESGKSPSSAGSVSVSGRSVEPTAVQTDEDIVINEVNQPHGSAQSNLADLSHWTLSTPVRRSSSLKFINKRTSPTLTAHVHAHAHAHSSGYGHERAHPAIERPSTSASHYRDSSLGLHPDVDDFDVRSHRSWRSSVGHAPSYFGSTLPKRHTQSSLSLHSNASGMSFGSSASKRRQGQGQSGGPSPAVLTQFEKQLLHKDLKRNSFRAVSATSKDFVMNPLFESELQAKPCIDDQDSGVDSCLNGFSGADAKYSNNSLLF